MADSTARNYYQYMNEAIPDFKRTEVVTRTKKRPQKMVLNPSEVPFNRFEKVLMTVGGLVTIILMFVAVTFSISATSAQRQLQNSNTRVSVMKNHNTDLEQEIGELTSTERINKIAKQQGLQQIESNIRTIR